MHPELSHYLGMIEDLRGQVRNLIADLPRDGLNWRPLRSEEHSTNSIAVLATHIAGAEHFWIGETVAGTSSTRNREAEFSVQVDDSTALVHLLDRVGVETRDIFALLEPVDLDGMRQARERMVSVRWCILHVIDHSALHLGHMQLTYQLWHEGQSGPSPRWFERAP